MGAETLVTQVKAAVDSGTTMSLAADTLETLSEDDTSISFTAVAGTATSLTGFYGDISNDSGSTWTYTLHTSAIVSSAAVMMAASLVPVMVIVTSLVVPSSAVTVIVSVVL